MRNKIKIKIIVEKTYGNIGGNIEPSKTHAFQYFLVSLKPKLLG